MSDEIKVGDTVKCIDAKEASNWLEVGGLYKVQTVAGAMIEVNDGGASWHRWNRNRFIKMPTTEADTPTYSIVAEAPGQEETKLGKPLIASPAPIRAFHLPLPLHCAICGSRAAGSDIAWSGFSYAAKPGERQHFCPPCSEQVASFIAHLKDKSNWYNPDVDD